MYNIAFDKTTGIVHATIDGALGDAEIARYKAELDRAVTRAVARMGCLKLIIDLSDAPLLTADASNQFKDMQTKGPHSPGDQVVFLVRSELLKLQMRRMFAGAPLEFYSTEEDARSALVATA